MRWAKLSRASLSTSSPPEAQAADQDLLQGSSHSSHSKNSRDRQKPPPPASSGVPVGMRLREAGTWFSEKLPLLAVVAVGLLAARPLFEPRLIHGADTLPHYYTLVQLDHLVRQGIAYTRWFPYKASGFGAPFFQYYAPLAFYVVQGFVELGLGLLAAFRLAWGLTLVGGALGMYLWVRDVLDDGPALIAAAAYVCGPYMLYNAFYRGGFTEQYALMLMPFVLWACRRLALTGRARYLVIGSLTYAALHLVHTLTALVFTPALLAYTLVVARQATGQPWGPKGRRRALLKQWLALGLGLGTSAFFWLPAFAERSALMTDLVSGSPGLDYHFNFISLKRLLATPLTYGVRPALSLTAVLLAVVGVVAQVRKKTGVSNPWEVWLAALVAGGCIVLALPVSVWIWDAVPPLRLFQFPHRFLSVAVLFLAYLAGVGVQGLGRFLRARWSLAARWLTPGMLLLVVGLLASQTRVLRWVNYYPPLPEIDVGFIMQKEREAAPILGEYTSVYTPVGVKELPPLAEQAQDGPERLDLDSLPAGATVQTADYDPFRYDLTLASPEPFSARFRTFYFPGWAAEVDGKPVPIAVTKPHGQISVDVPAGEHHLVVWFGSTLIRTMATASSVGSVALLGLAVLVRWIRDHRRGRRVGP